MHSIATIVIGLTKVKKNCITFWFFWGKVLSNPHFTNFFAKLPVNKVLKIIFIESIGKRVHRKIQEKWLTLLNQLGDQWNIHTPSLQKLPNSHINSTTKTVGWLDTGSLASQQHSHCSTKSMEWVSYSIIFEMKIKNSSSF